MDKNYDYCNCDENNEKKVKEFINSLEHQGCIVQEGQLKYIDILKYCSEGIINSALGNNAGAPYDIWTIWINIGMYFGLHLKNKPNRTILGQYLSLKCVKRAKQNLTYYRMPDTI